jgi:hypothetical protein
MNVVAVAVNGVRSIVAMADPTSTDIVCADNGNTPVIRRD